METAGEPQAGEPPARRPQFEGPQFEGPQFEGPQVTDTQGGRDDLRASDADRDRTAEILRQHCTAGRLDFEEYSERLSRALAARTLPELYEITADLPHPDAVVPGERARPRRRSRSSPPSFLAPGRPGALLPAGGAGLGFAIAIAALVLSVYGPLAWAIWVFWVFVAIFVVAGATMAARRVWASRK